MSDEVELYRRYRPTTFKQMIGQPEAVKMLEDMVKNKRVPHALLLTGPSGCGKTTLARILKDKLQCADGDFSELNCADARGIETVRDIRGRMNLSPIGGKVRIWLLDEAHKLTGDAQTALLKMIEDTPDHVHFMLCTTDPHKLIKTIHTRCTEIKLGLLTNKNVHLLITSVFKTHNGQKEICLQDEVVERLVDVSEGSARKALVLLNQIINLDPDEQLEAIQSSTTRQQAIDIARALIKPKASWAEVAKIVKEVDEEPESIRRLILAYASSVLLGGGKLAPRAYLVINAFESNFFDSGKAGLVRACYEVVSSD